MPEHSQPESIDACQCMGFNYCATCLMAGIKRKPIPVKAFLVWLRREAETLSGPRITHAMREYDTWVQAGRPDIHDPDRVGQLPGTRKRANA